MESRRAVGCTGHQDIPQAIQQDIRASLVQVCAHFAPNLTGITSLAAGADQLFASVVLESGGDLHVIVPAQHYESSFADPADLARYRALLARASRVEHLDHAQPSDDAYDAAGRCVVDRADEVIAVWDGRPAKGKGGTAEIVAYARARGKPITNVWPAGVTRDPS